MATTGLTNAESPTAHWILLAVPTFWPMVAALLFAFGPLKPMNQQFFLSLWLPLVFWSCVYGCVGDPASFLLFWRVHSGLVTRGLREAVVLPGGSQRSKGHNLGGGIVSYFLFPFWHVQLLHLPALTFLCGQG